MITSIQIERFRSLYDVSVDLKPFQVLVGANGSGKSNFVSALNFLGLALANGLEAAVNLHRGPDSFLFRWRSRTSQPLAFKVTVRLKLDEVPALRSGLREYLDRVSLNGAHQSEIEVVYGFQLAAGAASEGLADVKVVAESAILSLRERGEVTPLVNLSRRDLDVKMRLGARDDIDPLLWQGLVAPFDDDGFRQILSDAARSNQLLVDPLSKFNPVLAALVQGTGLTQTYRIVPDACRMPTPPSAFGPLVQNGANLPGVVRWLQGQAPEAWERVLTHMWELEPRFDAISVELTEERLLALRFKELGTGEPWTATEISDGTIRFLALLTALNDPRSPLVVIEEPENSLLSWMVRSFIDACREVVRLMGKQIILTTHSPVLINWLQPDEILVAYRHTDGRTTIVPLLSLEPDIQEMWEEGIAHLFDFLDTGLIRDAKVMTPA